MQTCKYLSAICAVALLSGAISLRADETEAQIKAREALRQKMAELEAQGNPKPAVPAPVVAPKAAPTPPPVVVTPPPPLPPPPAPKVKPAPVVVAPPPVTPPPAPVVVREDPATVERTRAALRQKMSELDAQQGITAPTVVAPYAAKPNTPAAHTVVRAEIPPAQPITPPPSPISATKEGRLAELLQKYKADAVSPEQYHTQRAAILAEP